MKEEARGATEAEKARAKRRNETAREIEAMRAACNALDQLSEAARTLFASKTTRSHPSND